MDLTGNKGAAANRFRVLDECDEMLNMGFVDDVEKVHPPCSCCAEGRHALIRCGTY